MSLPTYGSIYDASLVGGFEVVAVLALEVSVITSYVNSGSL